MTVAAVTSVAQAHVSISAFDVHLWSNRFDPADFNPKVHFLWSASDYRNMLAAGQKVELPNLVLFPLKAEVGPRRNHFWHRYGVAVDNMPSGPATPLGDAREFLWPLRCRPRNFKLAFAASKAAAPPNVWATIWLWPFGWSSSIEFEVTAPFSLGDLQDLGMKLRGNAPPPFVLNGQALPLSGVFKRLAETLRQDMAMPGKSPEHATHLARHVVYALQLPRGMQAPAKAKGWPAADRQRMLGALRGAEIALEQFVKGGFSFAPLGEGSFAVTDFNAGTLLMLRHWKDRFGATRETNHCLFANVRAFSTVYFALQRLIQHAKIRPDLAGAADTAKKMLFALPEEYRNGLCVHFKNHYSSHQSMP